MPDLDDFMKHVGAPADLGTGKTADPARPPPVDSGGSTLHDINQSVLDVERGVDKSVAGSAVAIPRLINRGIDWLRPGWGDTLGNLAERVPGVKAMEDFADSPNETASEKAGYWGGEIGQWFIPFGGAAKAVSAGSSLADLARGATDFGEITKAAKAGSAATKAAAPATEAAAAAPEAGEFVSTGTKEFDDMIKATRAERRAAEGETGRTIQANQSLMRDQAASEGRRGIEFLEDPGPRSPGLGWPYPYGSRLGLLASKAGGGAVRGGLQGAMADPQNPWGGFAGGAATGGLAPLAGGALRSSWGQWMAEHGARSAAAGLAFSIAKALNIDSAWLWGLSVPQLLRFYNSPLGRRIGQLARRGARGAGSAMLGGGGRGIGGTSGAAASAFNSSGWLPEPPPETDDDQQDREPQRQPQAQVD